MQNSPAVKVALEHIEAWTHHDWEKTRRMLAPDVHASVTSTQPGFGGGEFSGAENYMARKTKAAQLIEPGSTQVISAVGDERSALVTTTFRIAMGPGGAMVTMARACLYRLGGDGRIQDERDAFFLLSPAAVPPRTSPHVVQFEITGGEPARLQGFYRDLFGWPLRTTPGGQTASYLRTSVADTGLPGAVGPTRSGANGAREPGWDGGSGHLTIYVEVADIDAVVAHAERLGGRLVSPVHRVPGKPLAVALVADPEGHVVGLSQGLGNVLKQTGYAM